MTPKRVASVVGVTAALFLVTVGAGSAREATETTGADSPLTAAIYPGICGEGGEIGAEPIFPLGVIGPAADENPDAPTVEEVQGLVLSPPVTSLTELIVAEFDDLFASPHALVVEAAADGGFVACGQLGGVVDEGRLAIGLRPLSEARYYGVALVDDAVRDTDLGQDELLVTIFLFQEQGPAGPLGAGADGEGAATPTP